MQADANFRSLRITLAIKCKVQAATAAVEIFQAGSSYQAQQRTSPE